MPKHNANSTVEIWLMLLRVILWNWWYLKRFFFYNVINKQIHFKDATLPYFIISDKATHSEGVSPAMGQWRGISSSRR